MSGSNGGLAQQVSLVAAVMAASFILSGCLKQFSANHNDVKLKELERLAAEVPVPSSFKLLDHSNYSTYNRAGVYTSYYSPEQYDDVRAYYSAMLIPKGWSFDGQDNLSYGGPDEGGAELRYRKGDVLIAIQYEGANRRRDGRNYAVDFIWQTR